MNDEAFGVEFEIGEESNRLFFFKLLYMFCICQSFKKLIL